MTRAAKFPFAGSVRAVTFDVGNTLTPVDHFRIAAILRRHGIAADEDSVRDAETRSRPELDRLLAQAGPKEGGHAVRRSLELLLARLGASPAPDAFERLHADVLAAWPSLWEGAAPDARRVLDFLAARGFALGAVSNSDGRVRDRLARAGLAVPLRCVIDSGEVGIEKPDPRIFLRAAEALGVAPAQCLHVGDMRSIDVEGARAAGMHAVLLDPLGAWPPCDALRITRLAEVTERL